MLRTAEELGDPLTLAQAWNLFGRVEGTIVGSLARAEEAWRQALEHAERGNLPTERAESIGWLMMSRELRPATGRGGHHPLHAGSTTKQSTTRSSVGTRASSSARSRR